MVLVNIARAPLARQLSARLEFQRRHPAFTERPRRCYSLQFRVSAATVFCVSVVCVVWDAVSASAKLKKNRNKEKKRGETNEKQMNQRAGKKKKEKKRKERETRYKRNNCGC